MISTPYGILRIEARRDRDVIAVLRGWCQIVGYVLGLRQRVKRTVLYSSEAVSAF